MKSTSMRLLVGAALIIALVGTVALVSAESDQSMGMEAVSEANQMGAWMQSPVPGHEPGAHHADHEHGAHTHDHAFAEHHGTHAGGGHC